MRTIHRSAVALAAAAAATVALSPLAGAAEEPQPTVCDGPLSNVVVQGDVFVPYEASCTLTKVIVTGSLTSEIDSASVTLDRTAVRGDVQLETQRVVLKNAVVGGDVRAAEVRNGVVVTGSAINGDLTTNNVEAELALGSRTSATGGNVVGGTLTVGNTFVDGFVARNAVGGDLRVRTAYSPLEIRRNIVRGALDCTANDPAPTGGSNLAGSKLGQCSGL